MWCKKYTKYAIVFASTQLRITRLRKYPIDPKAYLGRCLKLKNYRMKTYCKRKKTNYDPSSDRFDDPSPMALVFLDRYLMVYKPVNARGARNLNIFLDLQSTF